MQRKNHVLHDVLLSEQIMPPPPPNVCFTHIHSGTDKQDKTDRAKGLERVRTVIRLRKNAPADIALCGELLQTCLPPDNTGDIAVIGDAAELIGAMHAARKHERGYVRGITSVLIIDLSLVLWFLECGRQ